jgi:hypothetical protein
MSLIQNNMDKFKELFKGNSEAYGKHVPEKKVVEGEKAKGKSFTITEPVTYKDYLQHLHGKTSIGIIPIDHENNIRFGAIDVDVYPLDPKFYLTIIKRANLPLVPFRTKSGGLHLFIFFSEDTPAAKAVPLLEQIRQLLSLPRDTEVFPKQKRLVSSATGTWINLPYFDADKTVRYAYDIEGNKLTLDKAVELCYSSRTNLASLKALLDSLVMSQAPPCIQTIFMSGGADGGERNIFLFNCAIYLKARFGKDFGDNLHLLNEQMLNPIDYTRLDTTVISSHNKKDYTYQCTNSILKSYCDKDVCINRKFGKGGGEISDLEFGKLVQIRSSTPYYVWYINEQEMIFYSESEIMNQHKFRELCFRLLHLVPDKLTDKAWSKKLNHALEAIEVEEVEDVDDLSTDSLWVSKLSEFFSRQRAVRASQMEQGLVWFDKVSGRLHFKGTKLLEFLESSAMFRDFTPSKHRKLLKEMGAIQGRVSYPDLKKNARTWSVHLTKLQDDGYLLDVDNPNAVNGEDVFEALNFVGEEKF